MRFEDWPSRLERYLVETRARAFRWGEWDCCLAACSAIEAMTGIDPGAAFRGAYSTEQGAARAMLRSGAGGVAETAAAVCEALGFRQVPPLTAQRGDAVVFDQVELGPTLGLVGLDGMIWAASRDGGWARFALSCAHRAWRVG